MKNEDHFNGKIWREGKYGFELAGKCRNTSRMLYFCHYPNAVIFTSLSKKFLYKVRCKVYKGKPLSQ